MKSLYTQGNGSYRLFTTLLLVVGPTAFAANKTNVGSIFSSVILTLFFTGLIILAVAAFKLMKGNLPGKEPQASALEKWWKKTNNFIPIDQESKIETTHNYDNIRELDNKIPSWFSLAFVLTVFWAIGYLLVYHVGRWSPLSKEEYQIAQAQAEVEHKQYLEKNANQVDENNIIISTNSADIAYGKKSFLTSCVACHAADGGGGVGPNLTDSYWIHGPNPADMFRIVKYGVIEKGMIPWKTTYNDGQIVKIVSYLATLKGTKPLAPKEPQGQEYLPEKLGEQNTSPLN